MEELIVEYVDKLEKEWAPAALEIGLEVVYWQSVSTLVTAGVQLLICVIVLFSFYKFTRWLLRAPDKNTISKWDRMEVEPQMFYSLFGGILCVLFLIFSIINIYTLIDVWNWIGIYRPKMRLAYDIYNAALRASGR